MRAAKIITLIIGLLLASGTLLPATSARAEVIKLSADAYYPFNGDPSSEHPGYMIEMARAILEPLGHKVEYSVMPWARAIREAQAGKIDGVVAAGKGEVPTFVFPDEPQGILRDAIFTLKENGWRYKGVESLQSLSLGYISDYSYGPTFDAYIAAHKGEKERLHANTGDGALLQNVEMLRRGRITGVFSNPEVFYATLMKEHLPADAFRLAVVGPDPDPAYIAFSPKSPKAAYYAKAISDGTRKLRESGELRNILAHYGIEDWK